MHKKGILHLLKLVVGEGPSKSCSLRLLKTLPSTDAVSLVNYLARLWRHHVSCNHTVFFWGPFRA